MNKKMMIGVTLMVGIIFIILMSIQARYVYINLKLLDKQFCEKVQINLRIASLLIEDNEALNELRETLNSNPPTPILNLKKKPILTRFLTKDSINTPLDDYEIEELEIEELEIADLETDTINITIENDTIKVNGIDSATIEYKIADTSFYLQEMQKENRIKEILDFAVFRLLKKTDKNRTKRIDSYAADYIIADVFRKNGIKTNYNLYIIDEYGKTIYEKRKHDLTRKEKKAQLVFKEQLYPLSSPSQAIYLKIVFPSKPKHTSEAFMLIVPPAMVGLLILAVYIVSFLFFIRQKHLDTMKSDFVNSMTHELKTPISTISLAAQMLTDQGFEKKTNSLANVAKIIKDETDRLRLQVEKVLQISLFEKEDAILNLHELHANSLIHDIINIFSIKVTNKGGKIISNLNAENDLILVDEMHFTNILFNLMDNALKYSVKPLLLTIETYNEKNNLIITIEDNGIGIKKEDQKLIFEKFFRVSTGSLHNVKGFGLGLTYVYNMVRKHKGKIKIMSELDLGTKFFISIPTIKITNYDRRKS